MTAPDRHNDTARNLILNRAVDDLSRIVNNHDPETDTPIASGVWDRLDRLALEIEARAPLAEALAVPEVAALVGAATEMFAHYGEDKACDCEPCSAWKALRAALRAIGEPRNG